MPYQRRDEGLTFLKELFLLSQQDPPPAFVTIKSWNDYHEGHGIEPGYYYEGDKTKPFGMNQDPYFYTKLVAETLQTQFKPAGLPPLEELDPLIQPRFSARDNGSNVYGPLFVEQRFDGGDFFCRLKDFQSKKCRLIWDKRPAAGFRVNRDQVEQWGLEVQQLAQPIQAREVEGKWALESRGHHSKLSISLAEDVRQALSDKSRVFLVFSFFDRKGNSGQYTNLRIDYPARGPIRMLDRRTRIFNSWTWKWAVRQLSEAWFKQEENLELSVDSGELLIHAMYVVIPGFSRSQELVETVGDHEYLLRGDPQRLDNSLRILYSQDDEGVYGNLLLVDFEHLRVIPDVRSVVTE
jgi:hypothetical protein